MVASRLLSLHSILDKNIPRLWGRDQPCWIGALTNPNHFEIFFFLAFFLFCLNNFFSLLTLFSLSVFFTFFSLLVTSRPFSSAENFSRSSSRSTFGQLSERGRRKRVQVRRREKNFFFLVPDERCEPLKRFQTNEWRSF